MELSSLPESISERYAAVYIRQSDPAQIINNQGSTEWQRDLKRLAERKGWEATRIVLFADLGVSATPGADRPEFRALLNFIGTGQVGMIFVVDGSRLARNETDWALMLDMCTLTKTWLCVDDRISDPNNHAHRFRLGLNATVTQAASQLLRTRLDHGRQRKAAEGKLRSLMPIGYEYRDGAIVMTEDPAVRHAIRHVFALFDDIGTAIGVAKYCVQHHINLPSRRAGRGAETIWSVPNSHTILRILRNPKYAGVYVWGRSQVQVDRINLESGRIQLISRIVTHRNPLKWHTLLHNAYPGYITWEQYQQNQQRLTNNQFGQGRGAVREGKALLQGVITCGICGAGMTVAYQADGSSSYRCDVGKRRKGAKLCQCLIGPTVEQAVVRAVLAALTPTQIAVARQVGRQVAEENHREHEARLREHTLSVGTVAQAKARYLAAADRGLETRLLLDLERDWKAAREAEMSAHNRLISGNTRGEVLEQVYPEQFEGLNVRFSELWNCPSTTNELKKQLIRSLIKKITLRKDKKERKVYIVLQWHSDTSTSFILTDEHYRFDPSVLKKVVDLIREMSKTKTDIEIALELNNQGIRTGRGGAFSADGIGCIQRDHQISKRKRDAGFTNHRPADMYSSTELQKLLNIDAKAIRAWHRSQICHVERDASGTVRRYHVPEAQMNELRQQVEERRKAAPNQADIDSFNTQRMDDGTWNVVKGCFIGRFPNESRILLDGIIWTFRHKRNWNRLPPTMPDRKVCMRKLKSWRLTGRLKHALELMYHMSGDQIIQDLVEFLEHSAVNPRSFCGEFPSRTFGLAKKNAEITKN